MNALQTIIEQAWENRALLQEETTISAIREVVNLLDAGTLRVAEPKNDGTWQPIKNRFGSDLLVGKFGEILDLTRTI